MSRPRGDSPAQSGARRPRGSHYRPRTRDGRIAVVAFLLGMVLTQPPIVHGLADRVEPWLLGMPFLYVYLLTVYSAMIGVLAWAYRRGL